MQATDKNLLRWYFDALTVVAEDEFRDCQQDGEKVNCNTLSSSICWEAEGLDVLHLDVTYVIQDQRIRSVVGDIVPGEKQVREEGISRTYEWYAANRPAEYQQLTDPVSAGLSGRQWGELYAGLCRDYLEAMASPGPLDVVKALEVAAKQDDVDAVLDLFVDKDEGLWFNVAGMQATDPSGCGTTTSSASR